MLCKTCKTSCQKWGKDRRGNQRFYCLNCKKSILEPRPKPLEEMRLPMDRALMVLRVLTEGNSVRATERITDTHRDTVLALLVKVGSKCERLFGDKLRNIPVKDVQVDEIWGFVGKKQKALQPGDNPTFGDVYTFVALEKTSKLVLNFTLGRRDQLSTNAFIEGLRLATSRQAFQLSADGFPGYPSAVENTLSDRVDFAQIIKVYRASPEGERRYSPAEVVSTERVPVIGNPDPKRICTSHIERQNLTMRMHIRRLTRLTNGYSKKFDNLWAALCLYFAHYNFCRVHSSLRVTPAMESGITDHVWSLEELISV